MRFVAERTTEIRHRKILDDDVHRRNHPRAQQNPAPDAACLVIEDGAGMNERGKLQARKLRGHLGRDLQPSLRRADTDRNTINLAVLLEPGVVAKDAVAAVALS